MKKCLPWIIVGTILCGGIILSARACKITDKYSRLVGQYTEMKRVYAADAILKDTLIAAKEQAIKDLSNQLLKSEEAIGHMTTAIGQRDRELDSIRNTWANLSVECQGKLHELDDTWGAKYTLLEGVVQEKDKQISAWAGKYDAQVSISEAWKAKFEGERTLRLAGETLLSTLEGKYRMVKLTSSVKSIVVVAAAGFIGYTFIRGK